MLQEIVRREGSLNLLRLKGLGIDGAMAYLQSLEGVGPKTASCVLLFSFGMPAMPVDTHIFRVTKRLGLITGKTGINETHKVLTKMVPNDLIYEFHLGIIEHGRRTCKANRPLCGRCVIYKECNFSSKRLYKRKV
jgi:endonuclease-3